MSISGIGAGNSPAVQSMINLQNQLDQLSQELGTNQKSSTYAGLGSQSGVTVGLDAQLAAINGYGNAITDAGTRLTIAQTALQQIAAGGTTVLDSINQGGSFSVDNTGQTQVQESAASQLDQILSTLNTQSGNQYLFSGTAVNQPSVASTDEILNGNGAQAGLEQVRPISVPTVWGAWSSRQPWAPHYRSVRMSLDRRLALSSRALAQASRVLP
jgi:flagellar hook-associated protein 3 FlgL